MQKLLLNSFINEGISKKLNKGKQDYQNEFTNGCKNCESTMKKFCKMGTRAHKPLPSCLDITFFFFF